MSSEFPSMNNYIDGSAAALGCSERLVTEARGNPELYAVTVSLGTIIHLCHQRPCEEGVDGRKRPVLSSADMDYIAERLAVAEESVWRLSILALAIRNMLDDVWDGFGLTPADWQCEIKCGAVGDVETDSA